MKSCLQVALAIIVGLLAVTSIIVIAILFLLPKSDIPARPTPTIAPTATVVIAAIATIAPVATTLPTEVFAPLPSNSSLPAQTPTIAPISTMGQMVEATVTPMHTPTLLPPTKKPEPVSAAIVQPQVFLPAIEVAPTPTEIEVYRASLGQWMLGLQAWTTDLEALANSGLTISSPEWIAGFDNLEKRLQEQNLVLQAMVAPYGYINAKEILVTGMESCDYAVRFLRDGETSYFRLYMATCALAIEMATTKMVFAPTK